jgi:uncharacterized phiE125 gp8 family phage protein
MTLTITTAATASKSNLVTVADVRTVLGLVDRGDDALLSALVRRASDVIARHCMRVFALELVVEAFRPNPHTDDLILTRYPVVEIVSVVENGVTLDAAEFESDNASGILVRLVNDRVAFWPARKIVVTYRSGFDLPKNAPESLKQACITLVRSWYLGSDRDPNIRAETVEQLSSATYLTDPLPPEVVSLCGPHRNVRAR